MKFLTVFAAVLALAAGAYNPVSTWSLQEIDQAILDPNTDPAQIPYLIEGLNTIMANLIAGEQQTNVVLSLPQSMTVTLQEVTDALHDPTTHPAVVPYLETALNKLMEALFAGENEPTVTLSIPAMTVNMWSLNQLSHAIEDPSTDPELLIYIEHALNMLMEQIFAGNSVNSIAVVTPPGVYAEVPIVPEPVMPVLPEVQPTPVLPVPTEPMPVFPINPTPVAPVVPEQVTPVAPATPVASSPLVQLIVNVNAKQASAPAPEAVAPVAPTPVIVEGFEPAPVAVVPEPIIAVGPWVVPDSDGLSPAPAVVPPVAVGPWVVPDSDDLSPAPAVVPPVAVGPWVVPDSDDLSPAPAVVPPVAVGPWA